MPIPFKTLIRNLLLPVGVAGSCLSFQLSILASDQTIDGPASEPSSSNSASTKPIRGFTSRDRNRPPVTRAWNRSQVQSASPSDTIREAVPFEAAAESKIQFVSASGAEDSKVVTPTAPPTDPETPEISPRADVPKETPPLSVKEQLLNALRAQREATVGGSEPPAKPGTLTILHAPRTRDDVVDPPSPPQNATGENKTADPQHATPPGASTTPVPSDDTASDGNNSRIGLTRSFDADLQSTDPFIRARAQRYLRLEMQLLKLRASQAAAAELPPADRELIPNQPTRPHEAHESQHVELTDSENTELPDSKLPPDADLISTNEADVHGESASPSGTEPNASIRENIVVDGPIDRLGLANNLFAVGQYPLALEMYQQAAAEILTSHQTFWVEYQTANCLRRLDKKAEASQRYRKLANQPEAGWLSQQAQWWVETLEKIRILESTLDDHTVDHHRATVEEIETGSVEKENSPQPAPPQSVQKESASDAIPH
jgi:hypothetical protein